LTTWRPKRRKRPSRPLRDNAFLKLVFAGTAAFAVPSLRALHAAGHQIQLVITQPDKPGHRMKVTPPAVKVAAQELGLEVFQPERIRGPETVDRLRRLAPDLLVVVAYGQILTPELLGIPRLGAVNVHASLLPRHRGAAPIAHAILSGDHETGVTIMRMDEQLDHGPVLAQRTADIGPREDAVALTARLAGMGAELLVETLAQLDELRPIEQDHARATVAARLRREDGELDWDLPADEIDRRVRALQPWPGVTLPTVRGRVKVLSGHVEGERYVLEVVQLPGKRPAPARQVLGDA
jgi:methionyl-tRNA formyltransferase